MKLSTPSSYTFKKGLIIETDIGIKLNLITERSADARNVNLYNTKENFYAILQQIFLNCATGITHYSFLIISYRSL